MIHMQQHIYKVLSKQTILYLCIYVCVCICMYVCTYTHTYIYKHTYMTYTVRRRCVHCIHCIRVCMHTRDVNDAKI